MEETLKTIGINTELLNSKPIHSRIETEQLLGITNQSLNTFKRKGWLKASRFKNKNYYTTDSIIDCIKFQLNYNDVVKREVNKKWETLWA